MSFINYNAKEIHCKIVYYGPSLGGKTTNIQWVYQSTAQDQKSKLVALNTDIERTLFLIFCLWTLVISVDFTPDFTFTLCLAK